MSFFMSGVCWLCVFGRCFVALYSYILTQLHKGVIIFINQKFYFITKTQSHEKNEFSFY